MKIFINSGNFQQNLCIIFIDNNAIWIHLGALLAFWLNLYFFMSCYAIIYATCSSFNIILIITLSKTYQNGLYSLHASIPGVFCTKPVELLHVIHGSI